MGQTGSARSLRLVSGLTRAAITTRSPDLEGRLTNWIEAAIDGYGR